MVDNTLHEFNPQIVIVKTESRQIDSKLLEIKKRGKKIIWLQNKNDPITDPQIVAANGIDKILTSPVDVTELLKVISKLEKIKTPSENSSKTTHRKTLPKNDDIIIIRGDSQDDEEMVIVKGSQKEKPCGSQTFSLDALDRSDKYRSFLKGQEPLEKKYFSRGKVENITQKIREKWDKELEAKLKLEREKFLDVLFNEKHKKRKS